MLPSGRLSLRGRLMAVAAVAIASIVVALGIARQHVLRSAVADREATVRELAALAAREHAEALDDASTVFSVLGALLVDSAEVAHVCDRLLAEAYAREPHYTALAVYRPDGSERCRYPPGQAYQLLRAPYFARAVASGRPIAADYHVSPSDSLSRASLAWPVEGPAGTVAAVLVGGVDLTRVETLYRAIRGEQGLNLVVLGAEGEVLLREPDLPGARGRQAAPDLAAAARSRRDTLVSAPDLTGVARTFAVVPMSSRDFELGASVAVGFDPTAVAVGLGPGTAVGLAGLALAGFLMLGGIWIVVDAGLLRRLDPLLATAGRLGRGELDARTGLAGSDEVGVLARAFDRMADRLQAAREAETEATRRALEARDLRFRLLAETIGEVFWIWDVDEGRMIYLSPAFEAVWGRSPEAVGHTGDDLLGTVHPEDRDGVRDRILSGEAHDFRIVRPDGEVAWVRNRAYPVKDEDDRVVQLVGSAQDVTEERSLQEALLQSNRLEAVGRLAGGVAHDFNNILMAVRGHVQLVLDRLPADSSLRSDLEEIDRASARAERLTRQLLAFGRKQPLTVRTFDLNEQIRDTTSLIERLVGESIQVTTDLSPRTPAVRMDPGHLEQILVNLAVNARDAMPGGGRFSIRTAPLDDREAPPLAVLEVEDEGEGMDEDTLRHAFEPFFTTKGVGKGTGLGLATVYGLVTQAGGDVQVESHPGRGARFTLRLPAARGTLSAPRRSPAEARRPLSALPSSVILVVEDEAPVRRVAVRVLSTRGHRVLEAETGEEALELLRREPVDIVLSDVVMPVMGGVALMEAMRREGMTARVVLMSGYPGSPDPDVVGADGVPILQKPFTRDQLVEALARARPVA